jgi:hypothetical protein
MVEVIAGLEGNVLVADVSATEIELSEMVSTALTPVELKLTGISTADEVETDVGSAADVGSRDEEDWATLSADSVPMVEVVAGFEGEALVVDVTTIEIELPELVSTELASIELEVAGTSGAGEVVPDVGSEADVAPGVEEDESTLLAVGATMAFNGLRGIYSSEGSIARLATFIIPYVSK